MFGFYCWNDGFQSSESRFPIYRNVGFQNAGHWCHGARNTQYIATKTELERAEAIMANNPVLEFSPGDLRREGKSIDEYLESFTKSDQEFYRDYYEDEI